MLELTIEELNKLDLDERKKNDKILHYICFGIISICHYFIISSEYLFYFIPLMFSLFSVGVDWYSNYRFYHYVENHYSEASTEGLEQKDIDIWINVSFAFAVLTYLVLLTNTFLINLF